MKYDIFVSYRRSDREFVANVVRRLEDRGVGVWYDVELEGGDDWREKIVHALTDSDMLVIFFSEDCNNSRQLKKELAIADTLDKPVVPILIENTQPRGAYLYELADRNWIQAFPDPMSKIDELVEHLTVLASKTPGGLAGKPAVAAAPQSSPALEKRAEAPGAPDLTDDAPAAATMDDAVAAEAPPQKRAATSAPRATDAYVGKVSERGRKTATPANDILPFRWIDLLFLGPMLGLLVWSLVQDRTFQKEEDLVFEAMGILIMCLGAIGLYGALVFPFRYYFRRRAFASALGSYAISSLILYAVFVGAFLVGWSAGVFPDDDPVVLTAVAGGVWIGYALLAFIIYGILNGQRALRMFHRNIKKI